MFVHGCFWHGHEGCRLSRIPKSNVEFWRSKIVSNHERDLRILRELESLGWSALTVWQCELKNQEDIETRIHDFLEG